MNLYFHPKCSMMTEPRCCTFAGIGVAVGVAGLGLGAASASGALSSSPNYPNLAADSAAMANAQAANLPEMLRLEAAAQEGGSTLLPGFTQDTVAPGQAQQIQDQIAALQQELTSSGPVEHGAQPPDKSAIQSQIAALQGQLAAIPQGGGTVYKNAQGQIVPASEAVANFGGESTADIQGQIMEQLAKGQLSNAQQYDPQFIAQQLAEEQQANPQGVQARQDLYNLVQEQVNNPQPVSPVAQTMEGQIGQRVAAGSGLTPEEQATLDAAVNANSSGTQPNFARELTTGFPGEERALQNAGSGATWLSSGQTPADVQYREQQQALQDLSQYISGQTPESQFGELSGAQIGPTPNTGTNYLPSFDTSAAQMGAQAGVTQYGQEVGQAVNNINPWSAGISTALRGANTLGNLFNTP